MFASPVVEVAGLVAALATVAPLDSAGDDGREADFKILLARRSLAVSRLRR